MRHHFRLDGIERERRGKNKLLANFNIAHRLEKIEKGLSYPLPPKNKKEETENIYKTLLYRSYLEPLLNNACAYIYNSKNCCQ